MRPAMTPRLLLLTLATPLALPPAASAQQQPLGSVALKDAVVTGSASTPATPTPTSDGQVLMVGNATVTAKEHTAVVKLSRGGSVQVCSTSGLHLTAGTS